MPSLTIFSLPPQIHEIQKYSVNESINIALDLNLFGTIFTWWSEQSIVCDDKPDGADIAIATLSVASFNDGSYRYTADL